LIGKFRRKGYRIDLMPSWRSTKHTDFNQILRIERHDKHNYMFILVFVN